jgi:SRSO17 transposase
VETCQIGVFVGDARRLGQTVLDRDLYVPLEWTDERERCRQAGIPEDRRLAPKPARAHQLRARACAAGVPAQGDSGASGYGHERRRRRWLEAQPQASGLAVLGQADVWRDGDQRPSKTRLAALPQEGWTRLSAGDGATGPRWEDWRGRPLAEPLASGWHRRRLVRRRISAPTALTASGICAPHDPSREAVVRVAGPRWTSESGCEAAKGAVGWEHDEGRRWTGWSRHVTLARWAFALLTSWRAGAIAVAPRQNSLRPAQERSRLGVFKAQRGLASRCASPRSGCAGGAWSEPCRRPLRRVSPGRAGAGGSNGSPTMTTTNSGAPGLEPWRPHHVSATVVLSTARQD